MSAALMRSSTVSLPSERTSAVAGIGPIKLSVRGKVPVALTLQGSEGRLGGRLIELDDRLAGEMCGNQVWLDLGKGKSGRVADHCQRGGSWFRQSFLGDGQGLQTRRIYDLVGIHQATLGLGVLGNA